MNDNNIASKFKATIRILLVFGWRIILIIRIWPNSQEALFDTDLENTVKLT